MRGGGEIGRGGEKVGKGERERERVPFTGLVVSRLENLTLLKAY